MQSVIDQNVRLLAAFIPNIIAALLILIIGWIVASLIAAAVRGLLRRTNLDNRFASWVGGGAAVNPEDWIAKLVFYLIMLFVLIGFFQALALTVITEPLNALLAQVLEFIPRLLGAAVLLLVAWVVATVLRRVVTAVLNGMGVDRRLGNLVSDDDRPTTASPEDSTTPRAADRLSLAQTLGDVVYWLVFLLFLPAILGALALEGVLEPIQAMLNRILSFLPNIFAAALILLVGWFVARIVQRIVTSLLAAVGLDRLGERAGLSRVMGGQTLSGIVGLVVYIFILIPIIISALNALDLEAVTQPASNMLNTFLAAIPNIFGAAVVLIIAYVVGRVVASLIASLLAGIGFDTLPARLGLNGVTTGADRRSPSQIVGTLVMVAIMLFATIEALRLLNFGALAELLEEFTVLAGQIILGLVILAVGLYLANVAARTIASSGADQARLLATVARVAILVLAGAMALRQMGIANEIVNLAFGLLLGAVAVAAALAFGLGGREIAGRELSQWVQDAKSGRMAEALPPRGGAPEAPRLESAQVAPSPTIRATGPSAETGPTATPAPSSRETRPSPGRSQPPAAPGDAGPSAGTPPTPPRDTGPSGGSPSTPSRDSGSSGSSPSNPPPQRDSGSA